MYQRNCPIILQVSFLCPNFPICSVGGRHVLLLLFLQSVQNLSFIGLFVHLSQVSLLLLLLNNLHLAAKSQTCQLKLNKLDSRLGNLCLSYKSWLDKREAINYIDLDAIQALLLMACVKH